MTERKKRIMFSNSPPVQAVVDALPEGKSLAARMAEIADRYALLSEQAPAISDQECDLLNTAMKGQSIDRHFILSLPDYIDEAAVSEREAPMQEQLALKAKSMSIGERIGIIEQAAACGRG